MILSFYFNRANWRDFAQYKVFWIAFDKSCPSFIPILIFAHESNVQKCFLGSTFTHLLHYFISILQIEELLYNTKCFWETFDKSCPSF
jgi:hypothetical protein